MGLLNNQLSNAYCEINGAADGYLGWYVDRYDKWSFIQQEVEEDNYDNESSNRDEEERTNPLPPQWIHLRCVLFVDSSQPDIHRTY